MEFEDYEKKINSIGEIKTFGQLSKQKHKQIRFTIKSNEMVLEDVESSNLHK